MALSPTQVSARAALAAQLGPLGSVGPLGQDVRYKAAGSATVGTARARVSASPRVPRDQMRSGPSVRTAGPGKRSQFVTIQALGPGDGETADAAGVTASGGIVQLKEGDELEVDAQLAGLEASGQKVVRVTGRVRLVDGVWWDAEGAA